MNPVAARGSIVSMCFTDRRKLMFKRGLTLVAILALAVVFVAADHSDAQ